MSMNGSRGEGGIREGEITITIKKEISRLAMTVRGGSILGWRGTGDRHTPATFCEPSGF
jgi:hypothetical protein